MVRHEEAYDIFWGGGETERVQRVDLILITRSILKTLGVFASGGRVAPQNRYAMHLGRTGDGSFVRRREAKRASLPLPISCLDGWEVLYSFTHPPRFPVSHPTWSPSSRPQVELTMMCSLSMSAGQHRVLPSHPICPRGPVRDETAGLGGQQLGCFPGRHLWSGESTKWIR